MAMRHVLFLFFLAGLTGCIGHPLIQNPQAPLTPSPNVPLHQTYDTLFVGKSRDDVVLYYGAPSHTARLHNGSRILEYASRVHIKYYSGKTDWERCTVRFWLEDEQVIRVDDIGDHNACIHFLKTRKHDDAVDENEWLRPYYP